MGKSGKEWGFTAIALIKKIWLWQQFLSIKNLSSELTENSIKVTRRKPASEDTGGVRRWNLRFPKCLSFDIQIRKQLSHVALSAHLLPDEYNSP